MMFLQGFKIFDQRIQPSGVWRPSTLQPGFYPGLFKLNPEGILPGGIKSLAPELLLVHNLLLLRKEYIYYPPTVFDMQLWIKTKIFPLMRFLLFPMLCSILLLSSTCKKKCFDSTNPDCENYDPCYEKHPKLTVYVYGQ